MTLNIDSCLHQNYFNYIKLAYIPMLAGRGIAEVAQSNPVEQSPICHWEVQISKLHISSFSTWIRDIFRWYSFLKGVRQILIIIFTERGHHAAFCCFSYHILASRISLSQQKFWNQIPNVGVFCCAVSVAEVVNMR